MAAKEPARYRGPQDAIRIGMPRSPLNDIYYRLMKGSWARVVALCVVFFLLANLGFAVLYMLENNGIQQARRGDFSDAFFFSVQTISTIGYGSMSPKTPTANMLVTAEAMVGLLGFAMMTGLIFAKFSRPVARVLFSDSIIITKRNGRDCLMLRIANARRNELVEASLRIGVLLSETTHEGHKMRRFHDLELVRSRTPLFALSWLVMHEINEASPLFGQDQASLVADYAAFVVTLTGIDDTFADTVHARHTYTAQDIQWGRTFVDMIEIMDGGHVRVDYTKFHNTM